MSLGNWDPNTQQQKVNFSIDPMKLQRFITLNRENALDNLAEAFSVKEVQEQSQLMHVGKDAWFCAAETLNDTEIIDLIRFFTLAEKLPGWEAGADSPVIWLAKVLKKRGIGINKDLLLWIKTNSNNRFLPHGSLL